MGCEFFRLEAPVSEEAEKERGGGQEQAAGADKGPVPGPSKKVEVGYASRLAKFCENWKIITDNPVIISWISGYEIKFNTAPQQYRSKEY